ncbi:hypothetical protein GCM10023213_32550 [Prosthecobacter algae]|uniref:Uncharacterized protein n=2 Tax=Prosthecobacter algae TaxID=1144682 RepID=A0ABP9PC85_9BACT
MIRSEQSRQSNKEGESETCWTREESPCVRLELVDGSWPILPYAQMQSAWFRPESPTETLELRFPPYQVRIAGGNLRKLAVAFQKQAVESVRISTKSERMSQGDGPTWIASIEVEEDKQDAGADESAP